MSLEKITEAVHDDLIAFTDYIDTRYISEIRRRGDMKEEPQFFLYTVLHKLNNGLSSCRFFINSSKEREQHQDSLILILRTLVSDSLMTLYVIKKDFTTNEEIAKNIYPLYTDHLKFGLSNLTRFGEKFWELTPQQVKEETAKIKSNFSTFFKADGSFQYKPATPNMGDIAEYLVSTDANIGNTKLVIKAHNLYSFFSKYEHLGILSHGLTHRQYEAKNKPVILRQVIEAIMVVGNTIEFCLHIWPYLDVHNDQVFQSFSQKFMEYRLKFNE